MDKQYLLLLSSFANMIDTNNKNVLSTFDFKEVAIMFKNYILVFL